MNGLTLDGQYRMFNNGMSPKHGAGLSGLLQDREWRTRLNVHGVMNAYGRRSFDGLTMPQLRAKLDDLGKRIEAAKRGG